MPPFPGSIMLRTENIVVKLFKENKYAENYFPKGTGIILFKNKRNPLKHLSKHVIKYIGKLT